MEFSHIIGTRLSLKPEKVFETIGLIEKGATVPFIARYRKEATGNLDETQIAGIKTELEKLHELSKRKETVINTISQQGLLTEELQKKIEETWNSIELEDIYLPFKPKRKTRASVAREKGLEPLAAMIMKQDGRDIFQLARRFVKGVVGSEEEALEGARDIMAEWVNERIAARNSLRNLYQFKAVVHSKVIKTKEAEAAKYSDYFDFSQALARVPSHRLLAMRRGEKEGFLRVGISVGEDEALERLEKIFIRSEGTTADQVKKAVKDAFKRLLAPSIETEFDKGSKEKADREAIGVFSENLRQLLLEPPLGSKRILAIDPGFRTGCKTVCLDEQGRLLHNENIYPHPPQPQAKKAASKIRTLVETYHVQAIAIGNATAGRETFDFIERHVHLPKDVQVFMVNEAGASIYSASAVAREEFPGYDVTVRGAVSIGRRLMDPLAELVKIDPKSIGVGQYQHDVDQAMLKQALDQVVESCVNNVGVNLNTASKHLLSYVSGIGPKLAASIVEYRTNNGTFSDRKQLAQVPGLGPKSFEQAAGFLRVPESENPLDNTAVHPESYGIVSAIAAELKIPVKELAGNKALLTGIDLKKYISTGAGLPTLQDIMAELQKPGRDPRGNVRQFSFSKNVRKVEDLEPGMVLPGLVTNITKFGAFVDIGVKQDGLVHISELADRFVSDPSDVVKLRQQVQVKVLEVDKERKRIALSMKGTA